MIFSGAFSIRRRLSLVYSVAIAGSLLAVYLSFSLLVLFYGYRSYTSELSSVSQVVGATSRAAVVFGDRRVSKRVLAALQAKDSIQFAMLRSSDGTVLAEVGSSSQQLKQQPIAGQEAHEWGLQDIVLSTPIVLDGELVGDLWIVSSLTAVHNQILVMLVIATAVMLVIAAIALYLSRRLQKWIIEPLNSLTSAVQRVSMTKDFSHRLKPTDAEEINTLIYNFNQMLEQLNERDKALILAKNRAEHADQVKSMFLASVSHELRTPLHAILGMTEEVLESKLSTDQREMLDTVRYSSHSLLSIINDILDFSKIEAGKLVLLPTSFSLRRLLENTSRLFDVAVRKNALTLDWHIDDSVPETLFADVNRLSQVFVNLIGNAIKFTPSGGRITVTVGLRNKDISSGRVGLHIVVADTGVGIPKDQINTIFDSFTQVIRKHASTDGTGLGLTITCRLVELMGGWIWVESEEGKGSSFHINVDLPEADESGTARDPIHQKSHPSSVTLTTPPVLDDPSEIHEPSGSGDATATVLVVEDNAVNRAIANRMLQHGDYRVINASNGYECLEKLGEHEIDLILMDLRMPKMNGLEATKRIRNLEDEAGTIARIPIIALTANAMEEDALACEEAGMDYYLTKPLSKADLLGTIALALQMRLISDAIDVDCPTE